MSASALTLPTFASMTASILQGCNSRGADGALVLYTSIDEAVARESLAILETKAAFSCGVAARYDSEAMKTTGLANLIRAERDAPRADVFWSSEQFQMAALASEGALEKLPTALLESWPAEWRDPNGCWIAMNARARVLCFDSRKVSPTFGPQLWSDFATVQDVDGIAIADPRFGSTRGHFAAMQQVYERDSPGLFSAMLEGLLRNKARLLPGGNAAVVDAVLRGEVMYGFTDTDDAIAAMDAGKPLSFILPRHFKEGVAGGGTMMIPSTVGIVTGSKRLACAEECVRFLICPESEARSAQSALRTLPLGRGVRVGPAWGESDPLQFNLLDAVASADATAARVHHALAGSA
ncbi:MAG: hypothetical protein EXS10_04275 [Phycisphaerales bacterium]|nr:hypothetical protein [Phycisphaerales bacterium]